MGLSYRVRQVSFRGRTVPILMQNENGPCPLLAIANILLLQKQLHIHPDYSSIRGEDLIHLVAERVLEANSLSEDEVMRANQAKQIDDVIALLPRLEQGLDVNVRFNSVDSFEFTAELAAFDSLDITLLHGWLVDPEERATARILASLSYNQAVERVVVAQAAAAAAAAAATPSEHALRPAVPSAPSAYAPVITSAQRDEEEGKTVERSGHAEFESKLLEQEEGHPTAIAAASPKTDRSGGDDACCPSTTIALEGEVIEEFLSQTASQLTFHGLTKLYETVRENQLCVFFRNNHVSTLFKHEGRLYLLVTDQGYQHEDRVVWERLDEIAGDSEFVDGTFQPTGTLSRSTPAPPEASMTVEELELQRAIQLSTQDQQQLQGGGGGAASAGAPVDPAEADYLLALKLQKEDEEQAVLLAAATAQQQQPPPPSLQQQPPARRGSPGVSSRDTRASPLSDEEEHLRHFYGRAQGAASHGPSAEELGGSYTAEEVERMRKLELKYRKQRDKKEAAKARAAGRQQHQQARRPSLTAPARQDDQMCVLM